MKIWQRECDAPPWRREVRLPAHVDRVAERGRGRQHVRQETVLEAVGLEAGDHQYGEAEFLAVGLEGHDRLADLRRVRGPGRPQT